jgi:hypothetical protein
MTLHPVFADFSADPPHTQNATVRMDGAWDAGDHCVINAGGRVRVEFPGGPQEDELTLKLRALVSRLGSQVGHAPLTIEVNGQVLTDGLRIPGGGDLPQMLTFSVPGSWLREEGNVLTVASGADATSMLWLYRVFVESVWDRGAAEAALQDRAATEPALTYATRLGPDGPGTDGRPGPLVRLHIEQGGRPVLPADLSWRGQDGSEGHACFNAELNGFLGEFREADGTWSQWLGELVERQAQFARLAICFTTQVNWGHHWHEAGELSYVVEVGEVDAVRIGWRDQSGRSATIGLTEDAGGFTGHSQNVNEGALAYRGTSNS